MGKQQSVSSEQIARRRGSKARRHAWWLDTWEHASCGSYASEPRDASGIDACSTRSASIVTPASTLSQHGSCTKRYCARLVNHVPLPGVQVGNKGIDLRDLTFSRAGGRLYLVHTPYTSRPSRVKHREDLRFHCAVSVDSVCLFIRAGRCKAQLQLLSLFLRRPVITQSNRGGQRSPA